LFRHLPHHRSPTSATKPAGQDSGRSRVAGIVASTAPLAMEVQSFMDHLIALVLCLFEHFRASLGELTFGTFVVRILSPQLASPVSDARQIGKKARACAAGKHFARGALLRLLWCNLALGRVGP
jgi:hypothetical protein